MYLSSCSNIFVLRLIAAWGDLSTNAALVASSVFECMNPMNLDYVGRLEKSRWACVRSWLFLSGDVLLTGSVRVLRV